MRREQLWRDAGRLGQPLELAECCPGEFVEPQSAVGQGSDFRFNSAGAFLMIAAYRLNESVSPQQRTNDLRRRLLSLQGVEWKADRLLQTSDRR